MRFLWVSILALASSTGPLFAEENWQPVPNEEIKSLLTVAESALEAQWEHCRRGWCRAKVVSQFGDEEVFTLWWSDDRTGLEVETVQLAPVRKAKIGKPKPRLAIYLPSEQWEFVPELNVCHGFSGRQAQRLQQRYDVRQHKLWLSMLGDQIPKLRHLNRLRAARTGAQKLQLSRDESGRIRFDTPDLRLVLDPRRGFAPVLAEDQTKLDEGTHPELMLPIREEYDLAQDRHGAWYCRQTTRTAWPRGGKGDPKSGHSAEILDYDSRPSPALLRLSFEAMALPKETRVQSTVPGRPGTWIVGREKEGKKAVTEENFRELGKTLRTRGFAAEPPP